jgi:hypothetical protein
MRLRDVTGPVLVLVVCLAWAGPAMGQTWLPEAGTLSFALTFNDALHKDHYVANGDEVDVGHTRVQSYAALVSYSPTDRLMFVAGVPYIRTRYWGPPSHGGAVDIHVDDGSTHDTFTDLRVSAHYQLMEHPVALTPLVAIVVPTHDYETFGHAAHGRMLNEYWVGFQAGKNLDEWIPRTFTQLRYTYAFVEEVQDISHDRSNVTLEIGTFLTPNWNVSAYGSWQQTHGGIDLPIGPSHPLFEEHDRIGDDEYFNAGLGTGYSLTGEWSAFVTYMQGVKGRNGHKLNQGLTIGFAYGYRPRYESGAADGF